jgi:hypothetical protein
MSNLVTGLFDDVRHAVGARVDGIRKDVDDRLDVLASRLTSMLTAMAIITVTATFSGLAIAATLHAFGVPLWASLWGITLTAAVLVVLGAYRRRKQRASTAPALAVETTAADSSPPLSPD